MYPILFSIGDFVVPAWHSFLALGAIAAYAVGVHLNKRYHLGIAVTDLAKLFLICYIGGYLGARGFAVFFEQQDLPNLSDKLKALFQIGPMTLYGGIVVGIVFGYLYVHIRKLSKADLFDISMPAVVMGICLGRIGCFLNGDDYGKILKLDEFVPWWAVSFPNLGDRVQQIYRYPVQIIESVACGILVLLLVRYFRQIREYFRPSAVGFIALISYSLIRFFDEYLRGDDRGWIIEDVLSPAQLISILMLIGSLIFIAIYKPRPLSDA